MSGPIPSRLADQFSRRMTYLRLSVTDRCDLRCQYCMPEEGVPHEERSEILSFEEIQRLVRLLVQLGITQVRVTGGEPLMRRGLPKLIAMLSEINGLVDLSLTTNATLLGSMASDLQSAGLSRINISLDSLKPEKFYRITRGGRLSDVLSGINKALEVGLTPLKLNTVVMCGVNDDELPDLVQFAIIKGVTVRFLEVMPLGAVGLSNRHRFMSVAEMRRRVEEVFPLIPLSAVDGSTSQDFQVAGTDVKIGFISPVSERFCATCNRLRLSARGRLQLCLAHEDGADLKGPLRAGWSDSELSDLILKTTYRKPAGNHFAEDTEPVYQIAMSRVGG